MEVSHSLYTCCAKLQLQVQYHNTFLGCREVVHHDTPKTWLQNPKTSLHNTTRPHVRHYSSVAVLSLDLEQGSSARASISDCMVFKHFTQIRISPNECVMRTSRSFRYNVQKLHVCITNPLDINGMIVFSVDVKVFVNWWCLVIWCVYRHLGS